MYLKRYVLNTHLLASLHIDYLHLIQTKSINLLSILRRGEEQEYFKFINSQNLQTFFREINYFTSDFREIIDILQYNLDCCNDL